MNRLYFYRIAFSISYPNGGKIYSPGCGTKTVVRKRRKETIKEIHSKKNFCSIHCLSVTNPINLLYFKSHKFLYGALLKSRAKLSALINADELYE